MNVEVIETGSGGNCFLFDKTIMIDCGIPLSRMSKKVDLNNISYILLTHIHGDHFHKTTIRNISIKYPHIVFVCGLWLQEDLLHIGVKEKQVKVIEMNEVVSLGDFMISGVVAYHDVQNCGYRVVKDGHYHFHMTDTSTLEGITAQNYTTATIECNHHLETALSIINECKESGEFTHLKGAINSHLSVDKAIQFCKDNSIGELIPVHIGSSTKKEVIQALKEW